MYRLSKGTLPTELGSLTRLESFQLADNSFSGIRIHSYAKYYYDNDYYLS